MKVRENLSDLIKGIENGDIDYYDGVSIFLRYSENRILTRNLMSRKNKANEDKLIYELKKLQQNEKSNTAKLSATQSNIGANAQNFIKPTSEKLNEATLDRNFPVNNPRFTDTNVSVSLGLTQSLEQTRKLYYRERGHYHGMLHNAKTDEERFELASKIIATQDKIDKSNSELNQLKEGEIPTAYLKENKSAEDYMKVRNYKMYIARYEKQLLEASTVAAKTKLETKISEYKTKLEELI